MIFENVLFYIGNFLGFEPTTGHWNKPTLSLFDQTSTLPLKKLWQNSFIHRRIYLCHLATSHFPFQLTLIYPTGIFQIKRGRKVSFEKLPTIKSAVEQPKCVRWKVSRHCHCLLFWHLTYMLYFWEHLLSKGWM